MPRNKSRTKRRYRKLENNGHHFHGVNSDIHFSLKNLEPPEKMQRIRDGSSKSASRDRASSPNLNQYYDSVANDEETDYTKSFDTEVYYGKKNSRKVVYNNGRSLRNYPNNKYTRRSPDVTMEQYEVDGRRFTEYSVTEYDSPLDGRLESPDVQFTGCYNDISGAKSDRFKATDRSKSRTQTVTDPASSASWRREPEAANLVTNWRLKRGEENVFKTNVAKSNKASDSFYRPTPGVDFLNMDQAELGRVVRYKFMSQHIEKQFCRRSMEVILDFLHNGAQNVLKVFKNLDPIQVYFLTNFRNFNFAKMEFLGPDIFPIFKDIKSFFSGWRKDFYIKITKNKKGNVNFRKKKLKNGMPPAPTWGDYEDQPDNSRHQWSVEQAHTPDTSVADIRPPAAMSRPQNINLPELRVALNTPVACTIAERMMQKMGWQGGALGANEDGITVPIMPDLAKVNRSMAGLGMEKQREQALKERTEKQARKQAMKEGRPPPKDNTEKSPAEKMVKKVLRRRARRETREDAGAALRAALSPKLFERDGQADSGMSKNQMLRQQASDFLTEVLTVILEFVEDEGTEPLMMDPGYGNTQRETIHKIVELVNRPADDDDGRLRQMDDFQYDLFLKIQEKRMGLLNTESFGLPGHRQLCLSKLEAPSVMLVSPHMLCAAASQQSRQNYSLHDLLRRNMIKLLLDFIENPDKNIMLFTGEFTGPELIMLNWFVSELQNELCDEKRTKRGTVVCLPDEATLMRRVVEDPKYRLEVYRGKKGKKLKKWCKIKKVLRQTSEESDDVVITSVNGLPERNNTYDLTGDNPDSDEYTTSYETDSASESRYESVTNSKGKPKPGPNDIETVDVNDAGSDTGIEWEVIDEDDGNSSSDDVILIETHVERVDLTEDDPIAIDVRNVEAEKSSNDAPDKKLTENVIYLSGNSMESVLKRNIPVEDVEYLNNSNSESSTKFKNKELAFVDTVGSRNDSPSYQQEYLESLDSEYSAAGNKSNADPLEPKLPSTNDDVIELIESSTECPSAAEISQDSCLSSASLSNKLNDNDSTPKNATVFSIYTENNESKEFVDKNDSGNKNLDLDNFKDNDIVMTDVNLPKMEKSMDNSDPVKDEVPQISDIKIVNSNSSSDSTEKCQDTQEIKATEDLNHKRLNDSEIVVNSELSQCKTLENCLDKVDTLDKSECNLNEVTLNTINSENLSTITEKTDSVIESLKDIVTNENETPIIHFEISCDNLTESESVLNKCDDITILHTKPVTKTDENNVTDASNRVIKVVDSSLNTTEQSIDDSGYVDTADVESTTQTAEEILSEVKDNVKTDIPIDNPLEKTALDVKSND